MHAQSREALNHLAYTIAAGGSGPRFQRGLFLSILAIFVDMDHLAHIDIFFGKWLTSDVSQSTNS